MSKFTHEVEEKFHDVKEHVLLSVEHHGFLIAAALMGLTSAILLIGTIYVWCFHCGHGHHEEQSNTRVNMPESGSIPECSAKAREQNGKVRKRITTTSSSSGNINNNNSPGKSKIPVRSTVKSSL